MVFFTKLFSNKWFWIILVVLVIAVLLYLWGRSGGKGKVFNPLSLPDGGSGIPTGWSASPVVQRLRSAFADFGFDAMIDMDGTDEDAVHDALQNLSNDQLVAVYNEYQNQYDENLLERFQRELSGDDLSRAAGKFSFIN